MVRLPAGLSVIRDDNPEYVPKPPNAPLSLTEDTARKTQTQVGLVWTEATIPAGGPPLTAYRVFQNGVHVKTVGVVLDTLITGLAAGRTYTMEVAGVNDDGVGAKSPACIVTTANQGGVPGAPSNLRSTAVPTAGSLFLAWNAATPDPTAGLQGYNIYHNGALLATVGNVLAATVSEGITPASNWILTVKARNSVGTGPASNTLLLTTPPVDDGGGGTGVQRFRSGSWYEKPLPAGAPIHPQNSTWISAIANGSAGGYLTFTGGSDYTQGTTGDFSSPHYRAKASDPTYHLYDAGGNVGLYGAGGHGIKIPSIAKQYFKAGAVSSDAPMMVIVAPGVMTARPGGFYAWISKIQWNAGAAPVGGDTDGTGRWEIITGGATSFYAMDSYGITSDTPTSGTVWPAKLTTDAGAGTGVAPSFYDDEPLNGGHRGCNSMARSIDYDRLMDEQAVNYVTEMFIYASGSAGRWPMSNYESGRGGVIPEGARLRIKPGVNLENRLNADTQYGTSGSRTATQQQAYNQALWIARGLQKFGIMVGDNSANASRVKLQSTYKEGRGNLWKLSKDGLRSFKFATDWEVIADFYDPPTPGNTGGSVPSAPTNLLASAITSTSVHLAWTASTASTDFPLQGYKIMDNGVQVKSMGTGTSTDMTGLAAGSAHDYTVVGYNAKGNSSPSSTVHVQLSGGGLPTAPTGVGTSAVTDTSFTVSYTAATAPSSNPITNYRIYDFDTLAKTVGNNVVSTSLTGFSAGSNHSITVAAVSDLGEGPRSSPAVSVTTTGGGGGTAGFTVYAAGDVAHTTYLADAHLTGNFIEDRIVAGDMVFGLGDLAYSEGSLANYQDFYAPTWGSFKSQTKPAMGNHDKNGGAGYKAYWGSQGTPSGQLYYSFTKNNWLFIVLDLSVQADTQGAMTSAQLTWLQSTLNSAPAGTVGICAFGHAPRFSSGNDGNNVSVAPAIEKLVAAKADLYLVGHDHNYERFAKLDASGNVSSTGMVHITSGAGGSGPRSKSTLKTGSQKFIWGPRPNAPTTSWQKRGVLKLVFGQTSFSGTWNPVGTTTDTDSFSYTLNAK